MNTIEVNILVILGIILGTLAAREAAVKIYKVSKRYLETKKNKGRRRKHLITDSQAKNRAKYVEMFTKSGTKVQHGDYYKNLRTSYGLSLADVAKETGVSLSTLNRIENSYDNVRKNNLKIMAGYYLHIESKYS